MKLKDTDNINVDSLKIIPENLDGFKEYCEKTRRTRTATFIFTSNVGRHSYSFCRGARFKGVTIYQSICDSFKAINMVLDGIVKDRSSFVNSRYQSMTEKKSFDLSDYHDFIRSQSKFVFEEIYDAIKNSQYENIDTFNFNAPIPFVLSTEPLGAFEPKNSKKIISARLAECLDKHKELRKNLWLLSFSNAIYYYWSYVASRKKDQECDYLRAEIYSERTEKYIALSQVLVLRINKLLTAYENESHKGKVNSKKNVEEKNKDSVIKAIKEHKTNNPSLLSKTNQELYDYFHTNPQFINRRSYVVIKDRAIKSHLKKIFNINK